MKFETWYNHEERSYYLVSQDAAPRMRNLLTYNAILINNFTADNAVQAKIMHDEIRQAHKTQLLKT